MAKSSTSAAVRGRCGLEHPDCSFWMRALAVQTVDEPEEHAQPSIPFQEATDQTPAGAHDLAR